MLLCLEIRWRIGVAKGFVFCIVLWHWQQQQLEQKCVCVFISARDSEGTLQGVLLCLFDAFSKHKVWPIQNGGTCPKDQPTSVAFSGVGGRAAALK